MPLVIPPGFGLAALRYSLTGDAEEMITTCGIDLGDAGGDFVAAANNVAKAYGQQFPAAQVDADWIFRGVRLWVGQDGGASVAYDSVGFTTQGVASGTGPVQNTAILVKKTTARPGRQGRGRFYFPPFGLSTGSYSPNGVLVSGTVTDYQTRFTAFYNNLVGGVANAMTFAVPPVLLHSDGDAPNAILAFTLAPQLATQRRRLRP